MLTNTINFSLAETLDNMVFGNSGDKYAAEALECTFDNFLGTTHYSYRELIPCDGNAHGKTYFAPSYAEVIDWLFEKGIVILFDPAFTVATNSKIAFYYTVYKLDKENCRLTKLFEDNLYMSSFPLAMKDIVSKLIKEKHID